jgi:hypothetical protein
MAARYFDLIREMIWKPLLVAETSWPKPTPTNSTSTWRGPIRTKTTKPPRSPLELCLLPPVFLDYYLNNSGGYDVPTRLPYERAQFSGLTAIAPGRVGND